MTDNTTYLTQRIARLSAERDMLKRQYDELLEAGREVQAERDRLKLRETLALDQIADLLAERETLLSLLGRTAVVTDQWVKDNPT